MLKSKTVWAAIVLALVAVAKFYDGGGFSGQLPVADLIQQLAVAFGLVGVRHAVKKNGGPK